MQRRYGKIHCIQKRNNHYLDKYNIEAAVAENEPQPADEGIQVIDVGSAKTDSAQVATTGRGILPNSPAQKAGLRGGDIVTALDGQPINGPEELIVAVRSKNVGDVVSLTYKRDGKEKTVSLTLIAAKK